MCPHSSQHTRVEKRDGAISDHTPWKSGGMQGPQLLLTHHNSEVSQRKAARPHILSGEACKQSASPLFSTGVALSSRESFRCPSQSYVYGHWWNALIWDKAPGSLVFCLVDSSLKVHKMFQVLGSHRTLWTSGSLDSTTFSTVLPIFLSLLGVIWSRNFYMEGIR